MAFTGLTLKPFAQGTTDDVSGILLLQFDLTLNETLTPFGFGTTTNCQKWNLEIVGCLQDGYSDGYFGAGLATRFEFSTRYSTENDVAQILDPEPLDPVYISDVEGDALDWQVPEVHIVGPYLIVQVFSSEIGEPIEWILSADVVCTFPDLEA